MIAKVAIIDSGMGNFRSVYAAIGKIGGQPELVNSAAQLKHYDRVILPGVGSFNTAMNALKQKGLYEAILSFIDLERPLLGICLGMQLLMESSEEQAVTQGFGLFQGRVKKIPDQLPCGSHNKVPHIAWQQLHSSENVTEAGKLMCKGLKGAEYAYFLHSYQVKLANDDNMLFQCHYNGLPIIAALAKDNVYGLQFHPEKSGETGLCLLKNFLLI